MNVYETITNRIIESLDKGIIPWRKEWKAGANVSTPTNYTTKKPYRGINVFSLLCNEFSSNEWMTYKQAQDAGFQVRKGSKGSPIVFWKFDSKENTETGENERFAFARGYTVFNVEQIDGIPLSLPLDDAPAFEPIQAADSMVDGYLARGPQLAHDGGNKAFYSPTFDKVSMPKRESFTTPDAYYSTLFHELAHSTGHETRLKRLDGVGQFSFGSESYSKEELIAEFGAAFLCAQTGIVNPSVTDNHTAYIQNWIAVLKNDKNMAVQAAQRAQKAADLIRGIQAAE